MAQITSKYTEVAVPLNQMSFTPDVPSTALKPNEYNDGLNVETDVRGIRSMAGDIEFLSTLTGTPVYISGGFRLSDEFFFIVATEEGIWYAGSSETAWYDITPGGIPFEGYTQSINITEAWNGTVPFFNDGINPPMFLSDVIGSVLTQYKNTLPLNISNIAYVNPTTQRITLTVTQSSAPYISGDKIVISGVSGFYDGTFTVVSSTTTTIDYLAVPGGAYPGGPLGSVSPQYTWNWNTNWKSVSAGFMRIYNTPNVGSILVAGNLTAINNNDETESYPVTVQWSQAFGLNQAPLTWTPTITNTANQLEVPLRGVALDAFPCNGQFFLCSYWDTVVFSPLNYSTTSAPILGVRLFNQGRGLLSANCSANTDRMIYGIDARDIWQFDGTQFTGLGNQRVKNWFYDQLDPTYTDRVFMQVNTQRNQVEIYYPTVDAIDGVPNKMISYRYDLDIWNSPRDVSEATMACESPIYTTADAGITWTPNLASRTIVYARGVASSKVVMKDQGYSFISDTPITSFFRRDNLKLLKDYSGKVMVHRVLPEVINIGDNELPVYPSTGSIELTVEGASSVGSEPAQVTAKTMEINTTNPWVQIDQNSHRVISLEFGNTSSTDMWMLSTTTWQYTQVEDDR